MAITVRCDAPTMDDARRAAEAVEAAAGGGLADVLLYGSVARGEQTENSDIDLLAVFGDLDYDIRHEIQKRLSEAASAAAGIECNVHATDLPEWVNRREKVSSSFEREISKDAVSLVSNGTGQATWDKEMVMAMSNEQEALRRVRAHMVPSLRDVKQKAFDLSIDEKELLGVSDRGMFGVTQDDQLTVSETRENARIDRIRKTCAESAMLIEHCLETLIILQGNHPEQDDKTQEQNLRKISHNIDKALTQIEAPHQQSLRQFIDDNDLLIKDISDWRVQGTYLDNLPLLNEYSDKYVERYLNTSLSVAWTVLDEIEHQNGKPTVETNELRGSLNSAIKLFQTQDLNTCEALDEDALRQPHGPIPTILSTVETDEEANQIYIDHSPPDQAEQRTKSTKKSVCGEWMERAERNCVLKKGHKGSHRSKI